jgi:predicted amidophosphoribosyltransferase
MLDCSVALDFNLKEAGIYTALGLSEHNAKTNRDSSAIETLVHACNGVIGSISFYKDSDTLCAVPPSPDKDWDLPTEIAAQLGALCGKKNISPSVAFTVRKRSVKTLSLADKWNALEAGQLRVNAEARGRKVILIDDKYQSGTTAQFVASKLYAAGAEQVCGLFCIKTWRDTDNM